MEFHNWAVVIQMIHAELRYKKHYSELHDELVEQVQRHFPDLESGLQGNSWISICVNRETVTVDTFTSMKHQIKAANPNLRLVKQVIEIMAERFALTIFDNPGLEPHESG